MSKSRIVTLAAAGLCLLLLTGCWDNREPRRRAYILGVGVDRTQSEPGLLTVTLQLPTVVKNATRGEDAAHDYYLIQGRGPTLIEAIQNAQDRVSRELFLGQMRSLVLSSELSGAQYRQVTEEIRRHPDIEENIFLLVARGRADALMYVRTPQERLPALYFNSTFESLRNMNVTMPVQIWEFWRAVRSSGWEPILPLAEAVGGELRVAGLAVFSGQEIRGYLSRKESQGYLWLLGKTTSRAMSFQMEQGLAAVRSLLVARSVSYRFEGARPVFTVRLLITGELESLPPDLELSMQTLADVERAVTDAINTQIAAALLKVQQEYRSDVFGFGKLLYYRAPRYFDSVRWEDVFPSVRIDPVVQVRLTRPGSVH